jgi:hypothetical protein
MIRCLLPMMNQISSGICLGKKKENTEFIDSSKLPDAV